MASTKGLRVRDPVHGLMPYNEQEERVINSWPLQRLRGVHQLAMAYLGYPGCVHTRFDHTLGVMHLTGRMVNRLREPMLRAKLVSAKDFDQKKNWVRLAALLHDVGHGPFSHVSEHVLNVVSGDVARQQGVEQGKLHERLTLAVIAHDPELREVLSDVDREEVKGILDTTSGRRSVFGDIVSGGLDADKLDYLLRDRYFAGVEYGTFDLERVIDSLRVLRDGDASYLVVADEGVEAVEQLMVARYHMTVQVYRHKIRRVTDCLLQRAMLLAVEEGLMEVQELFAFPGDDAGLGAFVGRYLRQNDLSVLDLIRRQRSDAPRAAAIVDALERRCLPKEIYRHGLDFGAIRNDQLKSPDAPHVRELQQGIAAKLEVEADMVVVDVQDVALKLPSSPERTIAPEELFVQSDDDAGGAACKLVERSGLFGGRRPQPKSYISVFVVPPQGTDKGWRTRARRQVDRLVREGVGR